MIHADGPKEGKPRGKVVDVQTCFHTGTQVFPAIGQGVGQFQIGGRASFLHVVATDGNGVELGHVLCRILKHICDDAHRLLGRINVSIAHHELLEDVVLDGATQLLRRHTLFFSRHDVKGHDGDDRAIHGHRNRHVGQGDLIEKDFHVLYAVDGYSGFAYVALYPFVIGVVAPVGSQVKSNRQSFLALSQVAAVKSVAFFRSRESSILPNRPGTDGVHAGVWATQIRWNARCITQVLHPNQIRRIINGFDRYFLWAEPGFDLLQGGAVAI